MAVTPDGKFIVCDYPGCQNSIMNHYWGRVGADDWFFNRDEKAWCPDHIPDWVDEWRKKKETK